MNPVARRLETTRFRNGPKYSRFFYPIHKMSTFEKAQRRIIRDMNSSRNLDSISWANIMLKHTAQLTNEADQQKFWNWMTNPGDADLDETMQWDAAPDPVDAPEFTTAPENGHDIELINEFHQDGLCTYVRTAPKITKRMSDLTLSDRMCVDEEDEKVAN